MTAPSPALTFVHDVAYDVALNDETPEHALAELRAKGCNPDRVALEEAVTALRDRDGLQGGLIDPLWWLEADPRPGFDALTEAVAQCEQQLDDALRVLVRRGSVRWAS